MSISSLVWSTLYYVPTLARLDGGDPYEVGDSLYVSKTDMLLTNNATDGADIGVIGVVSEAPDLDEDGDRMVIRVTASSDLREALKMLINASEL